ncbi:hypothetical protein Patl1_24216 [Pistacia atlantica]|uniref:Uncharacterized protein n=1 Tax=Pistacia atlantica TaxID=434234 RepID=A0ACC1A1E2_9ROSI|nr:hypothetical protein Patl1_24216 [Pistacia atlantica]
MASVYGQFRTSRIDHARPFPSVLLNPFKIVDVPVSSTVGNLVPNDADYASSRLEVKNQRRICLGSRRQDRAKQSFSKDHELQIHWMTPEYIYPERNLTMLFWSRVKATGGHNVISGIFGEDLCHEVPVLKCVWVKCFLLIWERYNKDHEVKIHGNAPQYFNPYSNQLYSAAQTKGVLMYSVLPLFSSKVTGEVSYNGYQLDKYDDGGNFCKRTKNNPANRSCSKGPWIDVYADTMVGDDMRRGISRGQNRRLTTGEMVVVPTKALFMDEISNCLDSSTAYQIVACLQQLVHITDATLLISLLQPAPETFELFDDIILMAEGKVVYQRSHDQDVEFFKDCGFRCPQRKGLTSRKDQAQCWYCTEDAYHYVSVRIQGISSWSLHVEGISSLEEQFFYLCVQNNPELSLTTARLPVFFKQKELCFYPAWAYAIPASLFKIPLLVFPSAHSTFRRAPYLYIYVSVFRISLPDSGCCHDSRGFAVLIVLLFCGFVITHSSNAWVVEVGFLVSPLPYGEIGLSVNEFLAPRWQKLNANAAPGSSLQEKLAKIQGSRDSNEDKLVEERSKNSPMKGDFNFLLSVGWSYFLNHLISNISGCEEKKKLQLLSDVTIALRPGVHTALMGVSGAGKSTLLDCMAGRKTTGHIEGANKLPEFPHCFPALVL